MIEHISTTYRRRRRNERFTLVRLSEFLVFSVHLLLYHWRSNQASIAIQLDLQLIVIFYSFFSLFTSSIRSLNDVSNISLGNNVTKHITGIPRFSFIIIAFMEIGY